MRQVLTETFTHIFNHEHWILIFCLRSITLICSCYREVCLSHRWYKGVLFHISKNSAQSFHSGLLSSMKKHQNKQNKQTKSPKQAAVPPFIKCPFREKIPKEQRTVEEASQEDAENVIVLKSKDNILPTNFTNLSWYWCDPGSWFANLCPKWDITKTSKLFNGFGSF